MLFEPRCEFQRGNDARRCAADLLGDDRVGFSRQAREMVAGSPAKYLMHVRTYSRCHMPLSGALGGDTRADRSERNGRKDVKEVGEGCQESGREGQASRA